MSSTSSQSPASRSGQTAYTVDEYQRRDEHIPQTGRVETETYILALRTDPAHHKAVTALRNRYFPQKINKLSAHIALFRALPGSQLPKIDSDVEKLARQTLPFPIMTQTPFVLGGGHGVAIGVRADPAKDIFQQLKSGWSSFLSKQDHSFKAHYTIQNKVDDQDIPQQTIAELQRDFHGSEGMVEGLSLYLYDRGYWRLKKSFDFDHEPRDQLHASRVEEWPSLGASKRS